MCLAGRVGGLWLGLLWPALALLMVALNYVLFGAGGFQKGANGRLSTAATWLLAPYLIGAWINSRLWTWRHPHADEVCDGVYLGRIPGRGQATSFAGVLDLSAELPYRRDLPAMQQEQPAYLNLPTLDLIPPICCALGYSRSASAVAAWLIHTGRCADIEAAQALIRKARPGVVLHPGHRQSLRHKEVR